MFLMLLAAYVRLISLYDWTNSEFHFPNVPTQAVTSTPLILLRFSVVPITHV